MEYASISDPWQLAPFLGMIPSFLVFAYFFFTLNGVPRNKVISHFIKVGIAALAGILFFAFGTLQAVNSHTQMKANSVSNIETKYDVEVVEDDIAGLDFHPLRKEEQLVFVKPNKDLPFYSMTNDATTGQPIFVKSKGTYLLYALTQDFKTGEPTLRKVPLPEGSLVSIDPSELLR